MNILNLRPRVVLFLFVVTSLLFSFHVLQAADETTETSTSKENDKTSSEEKTEASSNEKEEDNEKDTPSSDTKPILDASGDYVLPDIVVTAARKKSKSEVVQDVPISTYVFSEQVIKEKFVRKLRDIGEMAPNVELRPLGSFPNTLQPYIRGMGMTSSIPSTESPVGLFVDGVYMGINAGAVNDLFDLESIEVLRGPQGTLFGRNVTGGAVLLRHRRPTGEFGIRGQTTYGNYDFTEHSLVVEGPITDTLSWKMGGFYRDKNGYFKNEHIANTRSRDSDTKVLRPMLTWRPFEGFEATVIGEITKYNGKQDSFISVDDKHPLAIPVPGVGLIPLGIPRTTPNGSKQDMSLNFTPNTEINTEQIVLDMNWDLGPGTLTSITGWREIDLDTGGDVDGTKNSILDNVWFVDQHQTTSELRYAFSFLDRIDMTVGVNYFHQNIKSEERQDVFRGTFAFTQIPNRGLMRHTAIGFFSQADIDLTKNLTLTLGGRYTWESKHVNIASSRTFVPNIAPDFSAYTYDINDSHTYDFVSGHAALSWHPTEDAMLFGSWTRSFRSGGYNLRNSFNPAVPLGDYGKERVDAFEVGIKTEWFKKRLRVNVSGFYNDFNNMQQTTLQGARFSIANSADATIAGFELETTWFPTENLRLDSSVGYIDADYDRFEGLDTDLIRDGIPDRNAKNLEFNQVPEWSAYFAGEYNIPLDWKYGNEVTIRASSTYSDNYALDVQNDQFQSSYFLVDASMSYTFPGEKVVLSLFGKNLTDKRYGGTTINTLGGPTSFLSTQSVNPGRAIGVSLSFEF